MLIRYLSDIHLEFVNPGVLQHYLKQLTLLNRREVLVLAGDIGSIYQQPKNYDTFFNSISKKFPKIFVITGNHEYYNEKNSIDETDNLLRNYFNQYNNISFLNNSCEQYKNYQFIGSTLWSKISDPTVKINDVSKIPNFNINDYNRKHILSRNFIENSIKNKNNCVVITHHIPSYTLCDDKYNTPKYSPYKQWFYSDLDSMIKDNKDKIKCWIYGHTHTPSYKIVNGVYLLCNPIGYPDKYRIADFSKQIELK
jgi:predicted phosphohydrolase